MVKVLLQPTVRVIVKKGRKRLTGCLKKSLNPNSEKKETLSHHKKRVKELDMKKGDVAVSMLKRAVKNGLIANYVLMDSWFVNDCMIKSVRSIKNGAMHLLGMCRIDRRKYLVDKKLYNAFQLILKYERKKSKYSRKYKSTYISLVVDYKG